MNLFKHVKHNGAINDLRMGTVDRRLCCNTCLKDVMKCVGHTGHMTLARPVYHVGYIDLTLKVLRSVCFLSGWRWPPPADLRKHHAQHRYRQLLLGRRRC